MEENIELSKELNELVEYSERLYEFIVTHENEEPTELLQIEFDCLFRVYSEKMEYICEFYGLSDQEIQDFLSENTWSEDDPNVSTQTIDAFMSYMDRFMINLENQSQPILSN